MARRANAIYQLTQLKSALDNMSKEVGADNMNKRDWEESEETVQDSLRQRIDALSRLREKMDEEDDPMEKQLYLMQCRQEQVQIRQQLRNVQGIGQSLGIIISFLDGMQSQLTSINAKLDRLSKLLAWPADRRTFTSSLTNAGMQVLHANSCSAAPNAVTLRLSAGVWCG